MLIAKDVIAQLKAARFKPEQGTWTTIDFKRGNTPYDYDTKDGFRRTFLTTPEMSCSCCAVGSLFLGCTLYANKVANGDIDDNWSLGKDILSRKRFTNGFNKLFSPKQLALIELAFEGRTEFDLDDEDLDYTAPELSIEEEMAAVGGYYNEFKSPKTRLIAIMENIVENNGTFEP